MWKVLVRGLTSHKLRLALTALAIVLGVGFVAGTFVLTDTINKTFSDLFEQTTKGTDVAVRTKETFGQGQRAPLPESVLADVQSVPGKDVAEGGVNGYAQFIDKQGKPVTTGGAPTLGISLNSDPRLRAGTVLREGAWPAGSDQVAMDAHTAKKYGFHRRSGCCTGKASTTRSTWWPRRGCGRRSCATGSGPGWAAATRR